MPAITLKDLDGSLHRQLKKRAARHHRSLNREILSCLENSVRSAAIDVEALIVRARVLRQQVSGRLTDRVLRRLKTEGRA